MAGAVPPADGAEVIAVMNGWTMGLDGWLWMGAWILVLVALVWFLVREPRRSSQESALDTLRGRLARGEITPDEFERARRLLEPYERAQAEDHGGG